MEGSLYLVTNLVNGKKYVGKTYDTVRSRWLQHIKDSKRLDRPLHRAIRKYGKESFKVDILGSYPENSLEEAEQSAIKAYNSYSSGYNATLGGDGSRRIDSDEVVSLFAQLKTAVKVANHLGADEGAIRSILAANNIELPNSESKIGQYRPVIIEESLLEFPSVMACARFLIETGAVPSKDPATVRAGISKVLTRSRASYRGLKFKYKEI